MNKYFILVDLNGNYLSVDMIDPFEISIIDHTVYLVECGDGNNEAFAWGCDLSEQYIRINADYTT